MQRGGPAAMALAAALALAGCDLMPAEAPDVSRPAPRPGLLVPPSTAPPSARSEAVRSHFQRLERDLVARGLLRTDGGGPDTPYGPRQLAENFVRVALYDEYVSLGGGRFVARETRAQLRRWAEPVRIAVRFGASVSEAQRARDRASIERYAARLARATGHPVSVSEQRPNYWVYIVSEDERPTLGPEWAALFPGLDAAELRPVTEMTLDTFCMVLAISENRSPVYSGALAVIRSELPDLTRLSCIHEELAQGLGLANDSLEARPSIFNDDHEFATLTSHDEILLRILYDRRLRPGMREAEVRPLLGPIIAGLVAGGS